MSEDLKDWNRSQELRMREQLSSKRKCQFSLLTLLGLIAIQLSRKTRKVMSHLAEHPSRLVWLLALVIVVSTRLPARAAEPSYDGKPLTEWLLNPEGKEGTEEAVLRIGTNGIPTLLRLLGATESNKRSVLKSLDYDLLKKPGAGRTIDARTLRGLGVDGFRMLGTNAASAVGEITRLFYEAETRQQAASVLSFIGPKGFSVLTNAIDQKGLTDSVVYALGLLDGGDKKVITRVLIRALSNEIGTIRGNAAGALAGKDAELAVPALTRMLDDESTYACSFAAYSLGSYGPAAKSAAPKLLMLYTNVLNGSNELRIADLGGSILKALRAIDQEAAAKAEEFLLSTGPLNPARFSYSVTRLGNGNELIAGGYIHTEVPTITNQILKSAQLLDTATGKWTEAGEMTIARYGHSAILLPNHKVLIMGGRDAKGQFYTSAELYDISTGTWRATGSLNHTHGYEEAVLAPSGKVRLPGVHGDDELYDPATEKWTAVPKR